MWREETGGSGGLGVLVRVPGLVMSPSLVSSAVDALLLLQVEVQDMPRGTSSTGEESVECRAVDRSEVWRSQRGACFAKEPLKESCSLRAEGRGVRCKSGGSSTSANMSSSEDMAGAALVGML